MRAFTLPFALGVLALGAPVTLALTASSSAPHPRDATPGAQFGYSIALSRDGSTEIVGAENDGHHRGAAFIFIRSGNRWVQQGPKLTVRHIGAVKEPLLGQTVAISASGNTAAVSAYTPVSARSKNDRGRIGAIVYTRIRGVWKHTTTLTDPRENSDIDQGAVALSGDGNTVVLGDDEGGHDGSGAAFVFIRRDGAWDHHAAQLQPRDTGDLSNFGRAVALAGDGDTAIVGDTGDGLEQGAVWVYQRRGGVWGQGHKIVPIGSTTGSKVGSAVALSADGKTALIGAFFHDDLYGAAWVFTDHHGTWRQLGPVLKPAHTRREAAFGEAVSLSNDGRTALIGGPYDDIDRGAVWLFTRHGDAFHQQGAPRRVAGHGFLRFGRSVALSGDGHIAMAGSPTWHHNTGKVVVYRR